MKQGQQPTQPMQPIGYEGKSRNLFGSVNMWAQSIPFMQFIMFIFGWFTVPVEILFRRNFGQRWLTIVNFYAGLLVLIIFTTMQAVGSAFGSNSYYSNQQQASEPSFFDKLMDKSMLIILLTYLLLASWHFFRMWWRNRTNTPLHSFDDGTSRFEPVARYLMILINLIAVPLIKLYMLLLPKEEQQPNMPIPPLLLDVTAFTNTVFEPLVLLILFFFFHGVTATWLLISAAALAIYANWKEEAKLDRFLDLRDSIIDSEAIGKATAQPTKTQPKTLQDMILQQVAEKVEKHPEIAEHVKPQYPDLMSIIEEMKRDKG